MRSVIIQKEYEVGDSFNYFFMSDLHADAPYHDRDLMVKELDQALEEDADIFIGGDLWSMLLNGDRKRYTPSQARYPGEDDHIGAAIRELFNVLKPYAHKIRVILAGNHEETTLKFHGIDPIAALIDRLNMLPDVCIEYLGYQGFIRLQYKYANGASGQSVDIKAHHGAGGKSEVTFGTITQQRFMYANIADIYWNGHSHEKLILPEKNCVYLDQRGNIKVKRRLAFVTAPYVKVTCQEETTRGDHARPMKVNYGNQMRTFQSTGGVMLHHKFSSKEDLEQRVSC